MGNLARKKIGTAILIFHFLWTILYFLWRSIDTIPVEQGILSTVFGTVLLITEVISILSLWLEYGNLFPRKVRAQENKTGDYPEVDIFILANAREEEEIFRTVNGCLYMDYPDRKKVHIYVLDYEERKCIKQLTEKLGVSYLVCTQDNCSRSAQLNWAMSVTGAPVLAVFDANNIPKHKFLLETVSKYGMSKKGEHFGFVQAMSDYFNPDMFQFRLFAENRIPDDKWYFQRYLQKGYSRSNSVILSGTNIVLARNALEAIGGFCEEDIATGIRMQKAGFRSYATEHVVVSGFADSQVKTYLDKKKRQTEDTLRGIRKQHVLLAKNLGIAQKLNYISVGLQSLTSWKSAVFIILPVLCAVCGRMMWKSSWITMLLLALPVYISAAVSMILLSDAARSLKWKKIYDTALFPFTLSATVKSLCGKAAGNTEMDKKEENKLKNIKYFMPHSLLLLLTITAIVYCIRNWSISGNMNYLLILCWLIFNCYFLLMSIFWITGRPYVRQEERIKAGIACKISDAYQCAEGITNDLTQKSISVLLEKPYDFDDDEILHISLETKRYKAAVAGKIIGVEFTDGNWKYVLRIEDIAACRQEYLGLLYDTHKDMQFSFSTKAIGSDSLIQNLQRNIGRRFRHKTLQYRKMARIVVNEEVQTTQGKRIYVKNYNYKYLLISREEEPDNVMTLQPVPEVSLECEKLHRFGTHYYLYQVTNYRKLHEDARLRKHLQQWIDICLARNNRYGVQEVAPAIDQESEDESMKYI